MKRLHILAWSVVLCLVTACIYPYDAGEEGGQDALVVEGIILAGGDTEIALSYPRDMNNSWEWRRRGGGDGIDPGEFYVWIEVEGGRDIEAKTVSRKRTDENSQIIGRSFDIDTRSLLPGARCRLHFSRNRNQEQYVSEWLDVLQAPVIDSLSYYKNFDENQLDLLVSFHGEGDESRFMVTSSEVWEFHAWYPAHLVYDAERDTILYEEMPAWYYCWNYTRGVTTTEPVDASALSTPQITRFNYRSVPRQDELNYLQEVYRSVVTVAGITQDNYEYWKNLDQISYGGGDLFMPNPSERRGNIRNVLDPEALVLGYISASAFTRDTLYYINAQERFYRPMPNVNDIWTFTQYFYRHQWPSIDQRVYVLFQPSEEDPDMWAWVQRGCTDCTMNRIFAGSKERPADWPNDHR